MTIHTLAPGTVQARPIISALLSHDRAINPRPHAAAAANVGIPALRAYFASPFRRSSALARGLLPAFKRSAPSRSGRSSIPLLREP